jgi:heptosyltransferase-3
MRIGFNEEHRWRGRLYSHVVSAPPGHRMERDLAAIRPLGIEPKERSLVLRTDTADEKEAERVLAEMEVPASAGADRQLVLLHPGARYWFKAWPAERFADLADRLADMGCRVIIGGGPEDGTVAEAIRRQARSSLIVVTGRLSLLPFVALLKRCALFIGNDTGAMHMAAAVGTPIVALFGPSNPSEWGPLSEHADVLYKGLDCRPCFHPTCRRGEESCMRLISIDEVFASAQRWLRTKVHS